MSNELKDGGPAFPTESAAQTGNSTWRFEGMSLRDYFAAKAMQGLIAQSIGGNNPEYAADFAYKVADAMLKARAV